jgi:uncharacterized protein YcfJ
MNLLRKKLVFAGVIGLVLGSQSACTQEAGQAGKQPASQAAEPQQETTQAGGKAQQPQYAKVTSVVEVKERVTQPRKVCEKVQVGSKSSSGDEHKVLGTVGGAVVGGLLGNQIGGGTGKTLATIAGAAGGAYAGRKIQEGQQQKKAEPVYEEKCRTVDETVEKVVGYEIHYRLGDQTGVQRSSKRPTSDRIPVKDGKLQIQ